MAAAAAPHAGAAGLPRHAQRRQHVFVLQVLRLAGARERDGVLGLVLGGGAGGRRAEAHLSGAGGPRGALPAEALLAVGGGDGGIPRAAPLPGVLHLRGDLGHAPGALDDELHLAAAGAPRQVQHPVGAALPHRLAAAFGRLHDHLELQHSAARLHWHCHPVRSPVWEQLGRGDARHGSFRIPRAELRGGSADEHRLAWLRAGASHVELDQRGAGRVRRRHRSAGRAGW
mmetsp:Transcript_108414/g.294034  ORF Transcript_108414/g.294034 Transcript_108414/m.294034 type:complete len:229 (-) Transcript_108414:24-710(-)